MADFNIRGKRIIVTGGSRGIGAAATRFLASQGARVVIFDIRDDLGKAVAEDASARFSTQVSYLPVDVSKRKETVDGVDAAVKILGGLDGLISAAGILRPCPAENISEADLDQILDVNLKGTIYMNQAVFPYLRDNNNNAGGTIVNIGSDAGLDPVVNQAHYAASKGGVHSYTRTVAYEWAKYKIRVNAVVPAMRTDMVNDLLQVVPEEKRKEALEELEKWLATKIPLGGRLGDPDLDLAPVLAFLVSDSSRFVTGQLVPVNGGMGPIMANLTRIKLNTGVEIQALGFGTWQDEHAQEEAVLEAIKAGYRHIDTARVYGTEKAVGKALVRAIKELGVPRHELFVTTKLWNNKHHPDDVEQGLQDSLNDLQLDYIDLFLMHYPIAWKRGDAFFPVENGRPALIDIDYVDTYKAMEKLLETGKAKAIGVSNFSKAEMERLLQNTTVVPATHQFELHPWLQQKSFVEWHRSKGIHVTQYSPFGNQNAFYRGPQHIGKLIDDPVLNEIGKKYGKNGAQVALAWGITQGHSVLCKSKTPSRIRSNLEGDFRLSPEDMKKIESIDKKLRFNDSSTDFGYNLFADLDGKGEVFAM